MDHRDILNAIAHYKAVAERMGVHPSTACRWKAEGIPPEYWPRIVRMARAYGARWVTIDLLESTSPTWGEHLRDRADTAVS